MSMNDLDSLIAAAQADFGAAQQAAELENAKARFLGKSGRVTELLKCLGGLAPEEKKSRGAEINQAKGRVEALLGTPRPDPAQRGRPSLRIETPSHAGREFRKARWRVGRRRA